MRGRLDRRQPIGRNGWPPPRDLPLTEQLVVERACSALRFQAELLSE